MLNYLIDIWKTYHSDTITQICDTLFVQANVSKIGISCFEKLTLHIKKMLFCQKKKKKLWRRMEYYYLSKKNAKGAIQKAARRWRYAIKAKMKVPCVKITLESICNPVDIICTINIPINGPEPSTHFFHSILCFFLFIFHSVFSQTNILTYNLN